MRLAVPLAILLAATASRDGCGGRSGYDPCAGKACGAGCRACPPDDPDCAETAEVKVCDPSGKCVSEGTAFTCPHPDCVGKACGDPCNPCGPDRVCPTFVASACDRFGQCSGDVPWLCYDPCAGKACGDGCSMCPPDTEGCFETANVKECDAMGRCVGLTDGLCDGP